MGNKKPRHKAFQSALKAPVTAAVEDLCLDALEEIGLALDDVVSLRLSGPERVFGYLDNGVLVLLWWDPIHQVCPSKN